MVSQAPTLNSKSISEMLEAILSSRICGPLILVWYSLPSFPNQIPSMGFLIKGLTWTSLKPESLHRRISREDKRYASHFIGNIPLRSCNGVMKLIREYILARTREKLRSLHFASERRGGRRGLADWLICCSKMFNYFN